MKKSLLNTNLYLKNPEHRKRLLRRSLTSSFAIEGIWIKCDAAFGSFSISKADRVATDSIKKHSQ